MKLNKNLLISFLSLVVGAGFFFVLPNEVKAAASPTVDLKIDDLDNNVRLLFYDPMIISWSSTNADSCVLNYSFGTQDVGPYGNQVVPFVNTHENFTATITCTGQGGSASDSVYAMIYTYYNSFSPIGKIAPDWRVSDTSMIFNIKIQVPATTREGLAIDVAENPSNLGCDTLSYQLDSNSTSTALYGGHAFTHQVTNLKPATTYCGRVALFDPATGDGSTRTGPFYFSSASTRVTAPVVTFAANPTSVGLGGQSTLTWSATNGATSCTASGDWSGTKAASGSQLTPNLLSNKTYSLTCTGPGGVSSLVSATVSLSAPAVSLTASSYRVGVGDSVTLSWQATNAVVCDATPWSTKIAIDDYVTVTPQFTTSYSITCTGLAGSTATDTVQVVVVQNLDLTLSPVALSEADGPATLTAVLNAPSSQLITISFVYTGTATLGTDYAALSSITIPVGQISGTASLAPINDTSLEPNETIYIEASATNANLSWNSGQEISLVSDDRPSITILSDGTGSGVFDKNNGLVDYGSNLTINATANPNSTFVIWAGCDQIISTFSCLLRNISDNKTVTATFNIRKFTIAPIKTGTGATLASVTPSSQTVEYGASATFTANPGSDSTFAGWSGACTGSNSNCILSNITSDQTLSAKFTSNLSVGDSGTCIFNGKNEVDAYIFCEHSFNLEGDGSTFRGAIASKGMAIDNSSGNSFFYGYDIDGNAPPGFRYLNIPRPTEVGNRR